MKANYYHDSFSLDIHFIILKQSQDRTDKITYL